MDLLNDKEVYDITMAREVKGAIRTYQKLGVTWEDAKHDIMDAFYKSEEETDVLMNKYWKREKEN